MKWKFEEGSEPVPGTADGQVSYLQGGQLVTRVRRQPVYPRTPAQAAEVGGVVAASRAYAYQLDEADAATYAGESCEGLNQFESWIWVWSLMQWLLQSIELVPSGGFFNACPVLDDAALDLDGGSLELSISTPSSSANSSVRLRASRPLNKGRRPRSEDLRTIGTISVGSPQDISAAYVAAFGGLPRMDTFTLFGLVVADPVTPTGSCECEWEVEWIEPSAACGVSAVTTSGLPYQSFTIDALVNLACGGMGEEIGIAVLTPGWEVSFTGGALNPWEGQFNVQDTSGSPRTELVVFEFSLLSDPDCKCSAGVELTIEEMP